MAGMNNALTKTKCKKELIKENLDYIDLPIIMQQLLEEFQDVILKEILFSLPPLRDIHHHIILF